MGLLSLGVRSFAYGKGLWVGVGDELYTSPDGITWSRPETNPLLPHIYAANWITSRGAATATYYTDDFISNGGAGGPPGPVNIKAHLNAGPELGTYWVGDRGYIYVSRGTQAGASYQVNSLTDKDLNAAAYRPSGIPIAYFAGDGGTLIRASNTLAGVNYQLVTAPTTADLLSGTTHNNVGGGLGTIIFVGANGTIIRSSDNQALQWSVVSSGTGETLRHVRAYHQGTDGVPAHLLIAVGDNGTILTSTDGALWTKRESGTTARLIGSAFQPGANPKCYYVAGEDGTLLESTNGVAWTMAPKLPAPQKLLSFNAYELDRPSAKVLGMGENGLTVESTFPVSGEPFDGVFSMNYHNPLGSFTGAALGNGRWVFIGSRFAAASLDGRSWTAKKQNAQFEAVAFGEGRFVAVGNEGKIGTSFDGLNWDIKSVTEAGEFFRAVAYGGGRFAAVGAGGLIMISDDGVTWTDKSLSVANEFLAITWQNGNFIAVGRNGIALRSLDNGETWTIGNVFGGSYSGIAYGNGMFVTVGSEGWTANSTNGINWANKQQSGPTASESRPTFRRVLYANGSFIATTQGGEFFTSTNGLAWSLLQTGINRDLQAAVAGNGLIAVGGDTHIHIVTIENQGAPYFTQQPQSGTLVAGGNVTLTAAAGGAGTLRYQWLKDGQPLADGTGISGATTATLTLSGVNVLDAGTYQLSIWNDLGSAVSQEAVLGLNAAPAVVQQPVSATVIQGANTNFTVKAEGPGPITYQWRRNGQNLTDGNGISGSTTSTLSITNAQVVLEGDYDVVVSNGFGSAASQVVKLSVARAPVIVTHPASVNANGGQTVILRVVAEGTAPLTYQWKKNGVNLADGGKVSGATTATLTIQNIGNEDASAYTVTVQNALGSVTSNPAQVNVVAAGSFLPTFTARAGGAVFDIEPAGNGEFFISGDVTFFVGNFFTRRIAQIDSSGTVNTNFAGGGANSMIRTVERLPDGKVLAGGEFFSWSSEPRQYIVRLNANGTLDTSFPSNAGLIVKKIVLLPDGKYLVGRTERGFGMGHLSRFNSDGTKDSTFTEVSKRGELVSIAVQKDGTIWAAGAFGLYKANANGQNVVDVDGAGSVVIVGQDDKVYYGDNNGKTFLRRNVDGTADSTFSVSTDGHVYDMAFLPNGQIVIVGNFMTINGTSSPNIALLESNGTLAAGFKSPYPAGVTANILYAIELLDDGSALVGGTIQIAQPSVQQNLQRIQIYAPSNTQEPSGFSNWISASGLTAGVNDGPNDDPDGDGLSNLAEFAFGSSPMVKGANQGPKTLSVAAGGQTFPGIQFTRNKAATGVNIEVSASTSVTFNTTEEVTETKEDLGNGMERVTVRSAKPMSGVTAVFFRVKVLQQ